MTESIILTTGRSGSNYLVDVLNSHPSINCHGELWSPGTDLGMERYKSPLSWMRGYYNDHSAGKSVVCSKLIITHCPEALSTIALDSTVRKIVLIRKNALAVAISSWFSNRYQNWSSYASLVTEPERIDPHFLWREIPLVEADNMNLENTRAIANTHVIYYEDFSLSEFNKVFDFLGVDRVKSVPAGRTPDHKQVEISNRHDIECVYKGKYDLIDSTSE
jgi:hypothetical protein